MEVQISLPALRVFKPFTHPHMDFDRQPIESLREFRRKCIRFGVEAPGVDFTPVLKGR